MLLHFEPSSTTVPAVRQVRLLDMGVVLLLIEPHGVRISAFRMSGVDVTMTIKDGKLASLGHDSARGGTRGSEFH